MLRPVQPKAQKWVSELVAKTSIRRAAKALGVADGTVTRVVANLPVQGGTALLIEQAAQHREAA